MKIKDPDTGDEESIYATDCGNDRHKVKVAALPVWHPSLLVEYPPLLVELKHKVWTVDVCGWRQAQARTTKGKSSKARRLCHLSTARHNGLHATSKQALRASLKGGVWVYISIG